MSKSSKDLIDRLVVQKETISRASKSIKVAKQAINSIKILFQEKIGDFNFSSLLDSEELVQKSKFPDCNLFSEVLLELIVTGGSTDIRFHSPEEIADYAKVQGKLEAINSQYFTDPKFLENFISLLDRLNNKFGSKIQIQETTNPYGSKTYKIENKKVSSIESIMQKANPEVKEGLESFQDYLKECDVATGDIDNLFESGLILITNGGFLKLGKVIIGKNQRTPIDEQKNDCTGEELMEFLSKSAQILNLPFQKPTDFANKMDIGYSKFSEKEVQFYSRNHESILFAAIGKLINRNNAFVPCFALNNRLIGIFFSNSDNCRVISFSDAEGMCVTDITD